MEFIIVLLASGLCFMCSKSYCEIEFGLHGHCESHRVIWYGRSSLFHGRSSSGACLSPSCCCMLDGAFASNKHVQTASCSSHIFPARARERQHFKGRSSAAASMGPKRTCLLTSQSQTHQQFHFRGIWVASSCQSYASLVFTEVVLHIHASHMQVGFTVSLLRVDEDSGRQRS
jgi:hypothetical protein